MALVRWFQKNIYRSGNEFRLCSAFIHSKLCDKNILSEAAEKSKNDDDMPIEMENPYTQEKPKCILCKFNIEPSYRNVRLLSQFMSPYTGKVYGRHITGLCAYKQQKLEKEIKKAQNSALLGVYNKDPNFLSDPDLYDSSKPFRLL